MDDQFADSQKLSRCVACSSRMAHDQRYCVDCGARRGPLPTVVAERLAAMFEQGTAALGLGEEAAGSVHLVEAAASPAPERTPEKAPWAPAITMPTPRAAAAAVLSMLAFGVLIGSFGSPNFGSLASSTLLLLASRPSTQAEGSTSGSGSAGPTSSSGAVTRTITVSSPAPTQPAASSPSTAGAVGGGSGTTTGGGGGSSSLLGLPPIHHVFLIVMSDKGFGQTFAPGSTDTYLSNTLARQGELINDYYAVAGSELANRVALISGEGPTEQTAANCPIYAPIKPATEHALGQVLGTGCVYPSRVDTIAAELTAEHKTWKAYVEGIGKAPHGQPTSCRHPKLGASVDTQAVGPRDPYVLWSNPFIYFSSVTAQKDCSKDDVDLEKLDADLKTASTAPTFAYITPGACDDGSDTPCAPSSKAGLTPADKFLKAVIPEIEKSAAYKDNGLIAITFDQAPQVGLRADPSACCGNPKYPNLAATTTGAPPALGAVGAAAADTTTSPGATLTTPTTPTTSTTPSTPPTTPTTPGTTPTTSTTPSTTPTTPTTPAAPTTPTTPSTTSTTPASTPTLPTGSTSPPATPLTTTTTGLPSTPTTTTTTTTTAAGSPSTGSTGPTTPTGGGGQVGLLLISRYVKPNTADLVDYYNHFSLLATIENLFALKRLGYAGDLQLPVFDAAIFNAHP